MQWQQLTHQGQHQARFGAGDDRIGLQMRLMQAFNDLGGALAIGLGCLLALSMLRESVLCEAALSCLQGLDRFAETPSGLLLQLREQLQGHGIVGFEASCELIDQTSLRVWIKAS